jgi:Flp pilus assembly protein TadG
MLRLPIIIEISTTFSYVPLFKRISVGGSLTTPITKTAWMRLGCPQCLQRNDNRGTSAVEFALVMPALITLLVGTFYVCMVLFSIGSLHFAVEESAHCAAVNTTVCRGSSQIITYAQNNYFGPATATFTYTSAACGNSVSASANYVVDLGLTKVTVPITATACFP